MQGVQRGKNGGVSKDTGDGFRRRVFAGGLFAVLELPVKGSQGIEEWDY
ncbi:hypothetical protein Gohar_004700 [Gossypium harknessii]|uniref:Uncharacterized protein n=1 Tax=Gossypium harknessii TaxID=34285 RepID=A0A7J9H5R5_9ROSI|nr:hypothetical protein [Gossypium harknessii]